MSPLLLLPKPVTNNKDLARFPVVTDHFWLDAAAPGVSACGQAVRLVEQVPQLAGGVITRIQNGHPALRGVERMRKEHVGRLIVVVTMMSGLGRRRVAQQPLEATSADGDIDSEDAVAIKVGFGIPTGIVVDHDGGERESLILGQIVVGIVEEERVTPSRGRCTALLARGQAHDSRKITDIADDLCLSHSAMITLCILSLWTGDDRR